MRWLRSFKAASYVVAAAASAPILAVAATPAARSGHQAWGKLPVKLLVKLPGLFCRCGGNLCEKGERREENAQPLPDWIAPCPPALL